MKKIIYSTIFICLFLFTSNNLKAYNNSIAFIQGTGICNTIDFRDTGNLSYTPTSYYWSFGDGTTANTKNATHTYANNGTYTIKHIVTNGIKSDTASFDFTLNCRELRPLKADFNFSINDSGSSSVVYFTENCDGNPTSYSWNFGDNTTSTAKNPIHTYSNSNLYITYNVTLIVTDGNISDTIQKINTIKKYDSCRYRKAYFQWNKDDTTCTKLNFSNLSHYTFTNFQWSFGTSSTSTSKSPAYNFPSQGYYNVKLIASSSACADTISQKIRVTCKTCFTVEADIDLVIDSTNKSKAKLYNYSTGIIGGHYWNFGDGSTSTSAAPTHTYTTPGAITLTYVVSDTGTCKDTAYIIFTIDSLGNIKRGNVSFSLQVIDRTNNNTSINTQEKSQSTLRIFPNPAFDFIIIKNTTSQVQSITIYDVKGALVQIMKINDMGQQSLDINNWPRGLYILISDTGERLKLIVQ